MYNLNSALSIANKSYAGIVDKSCNPAILHPLRVMHFIRNPKEAYGSKWYQLAWIVCILHDIVEDKYITLEKLQKELYLTFSSEEREIIFGSIEVLTRRDDETYEDYIHRVIIYSNKYMNIPLYVKQADIIDNTSDDRMSGLLAVERARLSEKYSKAYRWMGKALLRLQYGD